MLSRKKWLIPVLLGGGAEFTPADIANLRLWLKADADVYQDEAGTTPATADGHAIGLWKDQSGNSYDVSQATADNKPLLKLAANGINSKPAILFDGSNDILARTEANWLSGDNVGSVFVVYQMVVVGTYRYILASFDEATAALYGLAFYPAMTAGLPNVAEYQANNDTADRNYGNTAIIAGTTYLTAYQSDGADYIFRVNGVNQSLTANSGSNTGDWFADTPERDNLSVGAGKHTSVAGAANIKIAEIIVYGSQLTGTDLSNIEGYLARKYGVTLP